MSKEFKRCPRCNTKTPIQLKKCGACGLNYDKFSSATNAEAKSAFRMGEKGRVLHTKVVPSDISKPRMFVKCALGGWFGLHYFSVGRMWRGLLQIVGFIFAFIYSYGAVIYSIRSGYLGYLILLCGFVWVFTFITWLSDSFAILFNKFKYPVSLPYKNSDVSKNTKSSNSQDVIEVSKTEFSPIENNGKEENNMQDAIKHDNVNSEDANNRQNDKQNNQDSIISNDKGE